MKKQLLSAMIAAGVIAISQNAMAADGTITFNGNITAQTCTINGNGSGSKNFTVTLPTVSTSTLAAAGQTAGRTPFNIALTNCTAGSATVHTFFEAGPTTDASTGNLIVSGGATNVQLQLLNSDFSVIKAGFADASQNSKTATITSGSATLPYYVQYFATDTAGAGVANSSVLYTIAYQ